MDGSNDSGKGKGLLSAFLYIIQAKYSLMCRITRVKVVVFKYGVAHTAVRRITRYRRDKLK